MKVQDKISREEFNTEYAKIKDDLYGFGREAANRMEISYSHYRNLINGNGGGKPATLGRLLVILKEIAKREERKRKAKLEKDIKLIQLS